MELDGRNVAKNLWPQSYITQPYNAHLKDRLEDKLHEMVCRTHEMSLATAQLVITSDWIVGYDLFVENTTPSENDYETAVKMLVANGRADPSILATTNWQASYDHNVLSR